MRGLRGRHPEPAMVVAVAALVVALSGTAIAGGVLVSGDKLIKKNSLSGNRLRNRTVTGKQINLSKLGTVPNANFALSAAGLDRVPASAFSRVMYAHVLADGRVQDFSANVHVTIRHISTYCFSGLPFAIDGGSATIDFGGATAGNKELAELEITSAGQTIANCNAGETVGVTTSSAPGTYAPEPFYIVLYGAPANS